MDQGLERALEKGRTETTPTDDYLVEIRESEDIWKFVLLRRRPGAIALETVGKFERKNDADFAQRAFTKNQPQ